jgi:hypothetical protein
VKSRGRDALAETPITTPTSTAFGQLTGSYNWQRIIEFGMKVAF